MALRLAKSELTPINKQRLTRMMSDLLAVEKMPPHELRAAYDSMEAMRDLMSKMLDEMDGKNV